MARKKVLKPENSLEQELELDLDLELELELELDLELELERVQHRPQQHPQLRCSLHPRVAEQHKCSIEKIPPTHPQDH
jgi:hypothetical protein